MADRTRQDIERELILAVEQAREHYQALSREFAAATEIVRDVSLDNADGKLSLERNIMGHHALQAALEAYNDALHRFSEFVVHGRMP